jgi:hypothetical protein
VQNLAELPGQEIEGENIKGYTIKRAIMFENDRGFAFAHSPTAVDPYVTWQFTHEDGKNDYYWGKYYGDEGDALANFVERATNYVENNKVNEVPIPIAVEEEGRTYKAELHNPDEPQYPHLEVFSAEHDADAVRQANELCDDAVEGVYLLEVHELDDNYDSIRQIDLKNHDPDLRRFMDVDLIDFLGQIADKTIIHHPNDYKIDVDELWKVALTENPADMRLMWHCSEYGTHILNEDEVFTKDTGAYGYWVTYRPTEPSMVGYVIEVTGCCNDRETVIGNVYEVGDYYSHVQYVKENALILDCVSLTYAPDWGINAGKTITVPRYEYDQDRHRHMSESGNVTKIQYHPWEGVKTMAELLKYEQATRMGMPIGDPQAHIQKIADKMAELRAVPEQPQNAETAATKSAADTAQPEKPNKPAAPAKPAKPAKEPSFEDVLKEAQAKADAINRKNALTKGEQVISTNKNNIEIGE